MSGVRRGAATLGHRWTVPSLVRRWGVLLAGLAVLFLSGCEEGQSCFALGESCTEAAGFSEFFESNVPCCEGTCTPIPPPPGEEAFEFAECQ